MKRKMIRKLLMAAQLVSLLFVFAACGRGQEESSISDTAAQSTPLPSEETSEPVSSAADGTEGNIFADSQSDAPKVTVLLPCSDSDLHRTSNQWYDKLIAQINEYTGVDLTCKWYLMKTYDEQIKREMLSGELAAAADVIYVNKSDIFWEAAEEGMFWNLAPYIDGESYDNLAQMSEAARMGACHNGKMYGIPYYADIVADYGLFYRTDWLERLGLEEPTDWESFCKMLYAFTYNDPDGNGKDDTVGLFLDDQPSRRGELLDVMECWFGVPNVWGIDEKGDLIHKTRTEEYKKAYVAFRELYVQGLINDGSNGIPDFRDIAGKTSQLTTSKAFQTSQAGAVVSYIQGMYQVHGSFVEQGLTEEDKLIYGILPCVDTGRGTLCYPRLYTAMLAVSTETVTDEERLKTVLQFLNDVNDSQCYELIRYGWEGVTYELDERGNMKSRMVISQEAAASGINDYHFGIYNLAVGYASEENASTLYYDDEMLPDAVLKRQIRAENKDKCVINYGAQFVSETYEEKGEELDGMLFDAEVRYMTGEIDEAGFEAALESWWENGGEAITQELNEKYHAAGH